MINTHLKMVLLVGTMPVIWSIQALPASSQSTGYFSEWEDGNVVREIGRDIVEAGCRVDHETALKIFAENMEAYKPKIEGTPEEYLGVIFYNLKARQQLELDDENELYIITGTGECE
ncbi:MAG: hypothetical protein AAFR36_24910 [Bacteroidota bacterium]